MNRFIDLVADYNLYALVISGSPDLAVLEETWLKIRMDYADAMRDGEQRHILRLQNQVQILEKTYMQMLLCIKVLRNTYVKQFANELNLLLKSSFKFDVTKPDQYDKELDRALNRTKGTKLELGILRSKLAKVEASLETKGTKQTREYFLGIKLTLEDFRKSGQLDFDRLTVYEFCEMINRLVDHNKNIKIDGKRK